VTRPAEESGELGAAEVVFSAGGVLVVVVGDSVVVGSSVVVIGGSVVVGGSVVGGSVVRGFSRLESSGVSVVTVALPGGLTIVVRLPTETSKEVVGPEGSVTGMKVVP
jgi:NDP-sugar pyrophosphorylase family protein